MQRPRVPSGSHTETRCAFAHPNLHGWELTCVLGTRFSYNPWVNLRNVSFWRVLLTQSARVQWKEHCFTQLVGVWCIWIPVEVLRQYSEAEWRSCCFRWWTNQEKWCTHNLPVKGKLLSTKEDNRLLNYSTRKTLGSTFHMLTLCTSHRTLLNLYFCYWLRASFLQVHTLRGEYGVCFIPCSLSCCSPSGSSFGLSEACCVPGHV